MGTKDKDWPYPIRSDPDGRPYIGRRYFWCGEFTTEETFLDLMLNYEDYEGDSTLVASKDLVEW